MMNAEQTERATLQLASSLGRIRGKKALQKLIYLLQEGENVPLGLTFDMHRYGPYAQELDFLVDEMAVRGGLGVTRGDMAYEITPRSQPDGDVSPSMQRILEHFGNQPPWMLELISSILYLARLKQYSGAPADKAQVREKLQVWKGNKFKPEEVDSAFTLLEEMGYLPTS